MTARAGLNKPDPEFGPLWSVGGVWMDVDNDGLLDLVVINYLKWQFDDEPACNVQGHRDYCHSKQYKATPNQLFLNNGDGTFRDASAALGLRAYPGKGMGAAAADFDHSGRMSLFVANDKLDRERRRGYRRPHRGTGTGLTNVMVKEFTCFFLAIYCVPCLGEN